MQSDLHLVLNTYKSILIVHDDGKKICFKQIKLVFQYQKIFKYNVLISSETFFSFSSLREIKIIFCPCAAN